MDKIEKIKSLMKLKEQGLLAEDEFLKLKSEILDSDLTLKGVENANPTSKVNNTIESIKPKPTQTGSLRIIFKGAWFLFDVNTYIYVNDKLLSKESTNRGFEVKTPLMSDQNEINVKLKILGNSTDLSIRVNPYTSSTITLDYDRILGKYSSKYKLDIESN
jgi:hypothetical protein